MFRVEEELKKFLEMMPKEQLDYVRLFPEESYRMICYLVGYSNIKKFLKVG